MGRVLCAAVLIILLPAIGSAQNGLRSASLPESTFQSDLNPPRPDIFVASPRTYAPRYDRIIPQRPFFGGGYYEPPRSRHRRYAEFSQPSGSGYLRLIVAPASTEVHIDGFYLGNVDDFRRSGRTLEAGPHRVELRAPGQEPVSFNVNIAPNDIVTYRNDLADAIQPGERAPAAATPSLPPAMPRTFYVIPGCYAGDKVPSRDSLSPTCDITKLRTVPPAVGVIARGR